MTPFGRFLAAMLALDLAALVLASLVGTATSLSATLVAGVFLLLAPVVAYWLVFYRRVGAPPGERKRQ